MNIFIVFSLNQLSSSPSILSPVEAQRNRAKEVWPRRLTRKEHFPSLHSHPYEYFQNSSTIYLNNLPLFHSLLYLSAKTWSKTPKHEGKKNPGNLLCLAVSHQRLNLDRFFPSRYRSHASIVRFRLVKFSLSYCELKHLLQSNYCRDLGQHSLGNSKKCGPQHWHKHLSMLEEASLPLNRADAS